MSNFAKLDPPASMPPQQVQRIKDLQCPPPLKSSQQNARIKELNNIMKKQASEIEILEKQIEDLEKRYKITFSTTNEPKFDIHSGGLPYMDISGNLTNIQLDLHLWQAKEGIKGLTGQQGEQGRRGEPAYPGEDGRAGYYGIRGDTKQ